jgi:hypothetical protein
MKQASISTQCIFVPFTKGTVHIGAATRKKGDAPFAYCCEEKRRILSIFQSNGRNERTEVGNHRGHRKVKGYEHLSDAEAQRLLLTIRQFVSLMANFMHKNYEHE